MNQPHDRATRLRASLQSAWDVSWLGDGVEDVVHTPTELIYAEPHAKLRRVVAETPQAGRPVLLVTPLAVPATCWDLRPGQSLEAHLAGAEETATGGRPTYVISYGSIGFADRAMGYEDWFAEIIPTAIHRISQLHEGQDVHLVGWSMGGQIALLAAAHNPDLPVASIIALGSPIDQAKNVSSKPLMWLDALIGTTNLTRASSVLGTVPSPVVQLIFRSLAPIRELTKPWYLARNLHDREALARTEAIDRFVNAMPGYPGRLYNQFLTRIVLRNEFATGVVHFGAGGDVRLDRLRVPLLFIGSRSDAIASAAAVEAGVAVFSGSPDASYRSADGLSHLGLVAAPNARDSSWAHIDEFLAAHDV